jgi:hypothetical protein
MKFLLSLIYALVYVQSLVAAAEHQALYDIVDTTDESTSTKPKEEEESLNSVTRRKRVRRTVAVDKSSTNEVIDPLNNYMVLAENENALLRALNYKVYSVPPPKSKPGVSSAIPI